MPKRSAPEQAAPAPLELAYAGGRVPDHVPARDLGEGDLHRIARVRALLASGGEPVPPAARADLEALAAELLASGSFTPRGETTTNGAPASPAEQE